MTVSGINIYIYNHQWDYSYRRYRYTEYQDYTEIETTTGLLEEKISQLSVATPELQTDKSISASSDKSLRA